MRAIKQLEPDSLLIKFGYLVREYYEGGNQRSTPAPAPTDVAFTLKHSQFPPLQYQTFKSNIHIEKGVKKQSS